MFGHWPAIHECVSNYFVDYQEQQPEDKTSETRWLDRVVPDGTWSGNLFDFFRKVSRKLVADLKVPFVLKGNFRQYDTLHGLYVIRWSIRWRMPTIQAEPQFW